MSAIRLLPWPLHQALAYAAGVLCVVAPFALGFAEGSPLPVFVGSGVALLLIGVLGKGGPGVAQVLPATVHVGLTYILGFFLLLAPFVFGFADEQTPLATAVFVGLAIVVITLVAAVPGAGKPEPEPSPSAAPAEGSAEATSTEVHTPEDTKGGEEPGDGQPPGEDTGRDAQPPSST